VRRQLIAYAAALHELPMVSNLDSLRAAKCGADRTRWLTVRMRRGVLLITGALDYRTIAVPPSTRNGASDSAEANAGVEGASMRNVTVLSSGAASFELRELLRLRRESVCSRRLSAPPAAARFEGRHRRELAAAVASATFLFT